MRAHRVSSSPKFAISTITYGGGAQMATIKAIEGRTIHQIQSGQVIVDLCSVVKELVENSLDAGATSIEIRFKNQGLESIEVQDNGDGITPENYETVALKHHTSKLSTYSDLTTLNTFGFRGEALSSLCALSRFSITTCLAKDAPKGTKLDFEISGKLKSTSLVAAQKGTCVTVENLFNNLPVRRRELERKIKTEWSRVVASLGQYACIQTGVKISVTHLPTKGKKITVFSTKGNPSTRENIANVFGAKTLTALLALDLKLQLDITSGPTQRWNTQEDFEMKEIHIVGHISRPATGEGRQTPDRQMFFVNSRPCSLPQVSKAINEVYKSYNSSQSPFIFANIEMDTHLYDVNVSPDKRTILLHDQTRMLEHLKSSLIELFETQDYTVPISRLPSQKLPLYKQLTIGQRRTEANETIKTSMESTDDDAESTSESRSATDAETDEAIPVKPHDPNPREDIKSRQFLNRDRVSEGLIGNWAGRSAENRNGDKGGGAEPASVSSVGLSKAELDLVRKLVGEREEVETAVIPSRTDFMSPSTGSISPSQHQAIAVLDFNERVAQLAGGTNDISSIQGTSKDSVNVESIPALVSPARRIASNVIGIGTISPRPHKSPATTATIKIGDSTVTGSIGSTYPKRVRIDEEHQSYPADIHLPSFGSRLSQKYAAPGASHSSQSINVGGSVGEVDSFAENDDQRPITERGKQDFQRGPADDQSLPAKMLTEAVALTGATEDVEAEFVDEEERKAFEDAKVQQMIKKAEETIQSTEDSSRRTNLLLKGSARKKDSTIQIFQLLDTSVEQIHSQIRHLAKALEKYKNIGPGEKTEEGELDSEAAEEKLSLTIDKSDFAKMKIIGQFNLGFILASRTLNPDQINAVDHGPGDDLFIIDQHASDEKYNFERLQAATVVQSQRLVIPKTLDLTAVEEEIVLENLAALQKNGFIVTVDESGDSPVGQRCQLISLPLSRETTFSTSDLEELISLLSEHTSNSGLPPRPSRVRKMFAMRACRSSIMIGRTLTNKQMGNVVRHMGEIDKPWNCPHGRPTMRHLCGMGVWDEVGWREHDGIEGEGRDGTDWAAYIKAKKEADSGLLKT